MDDLNEEDRFLYHPLDNVDTSKISTSFPRSEVGGVVIHKIFNIPGNNYIPSKTFLECTVLNRNADIKQPFVNYLFELPCVIKMIQKSNTNIVVCELEENKKQRHVRQNTNNNASNTQLLSQQSFQDLGYYPNPHHGVHQPLLSQQSQASYYESSAFIGNHCQLSQQSNYSGIGEYVEDDDNGLSNMGYGTNNN